MSKTNFLLQKFLENHNSLFYEKLRSTKFQFSFQKKFFFIFLTLLVLLINNKVDAQCTSTIEFNWDNGAGSGNTWLESDFSRTYSNVGGSGVNVTLDLTDAENQNCDAGNPSTFGDYTETTGGFGNNVLTYQMTSTNSNQFVEFKFTFSEPILMDDFIIYDIDYNGSSSNVSTYQDEMDFLASNNGTNVSVNLSQHPNAVASIVNISGQNAVADYIIGVSGNVSHTDLNGAVVVSTSSAVTEFIMRYSNGPNDDGSSDDHAVSVPGFKFCKAPADNDGDGISDLNDFDDDNDGILDEIESCGSISAGGNVDINVEIQLDNYPGETSWSLLNIGGASVANGNGYSTGNQFIDLTYNVPPGDYTLDLLLIK